MERALVHRSAALEGPTRTFRVGPGESGVREGPQKGYFAPFVRVSGLSECAVALSKGPEDSCVVKGAVAPRDHILEEVLD